MTYIDFLVSVAIMVMIFNLISLFGRDVFSFSRYTNSTLSAQQDARNVLRQFASELRTASIASTGSYAIGGAATSSITFYSDTNGDGIKEQIRYFLSTDKKSLKKTVITPSGTPLAYTGAGVTTTVMNGLANGNNPIFTYYDKNYTGTSAALSDPVDIQAVRLVRADITIDSDPNMSPVPIVVTTQISIRNLKDNL